MLADWFVSLCSEVSVEDEDEDEEIWYMCCARCCCCCENDATLRGVLHYHTFYRHPPRLPNANHGSGKGNIGDERGICKVHNASMYLSLLGQ